MVRRSFDTIEYPVAEVVQSLDLVKPSDIVANSPFDNRALDLAEGGNGNIALELEPAGLTHGVAP